MQQVPSLPAWITRDISTFVTSIRGVISKGVEKAHILQTGIVSKIKQLSQDFEVVEWVSVEGLIYVTLLIVILTTMLIVSINVYRKIRYAIPARVNCWFCNTNTKVLYSLKDTWTCSNCHQYNGFTPDGHYNKRLPAQFIEALNRPVRGAPAKGYKIETDTNGLCSQCNLNQVLKVFQLASFVPVNERNYDAEIEAEQKRLEQLYGICDPCKRIVEMSLIRASAIGKEDLTGYKNRLKVNKVVPTKSTASLHINSTNRRKNLMESSKSELSLLHDGCLRDVTETSDDSGDSFLSLNNLKIGSKAKNGAFEDFHMPFPTTSARSSNTPISHYPSSSMAYKRHSPVYASSMQLNQDQDTTPIWKDYPMVQGRSSPTFSVIDSMSCPVGRPAYVACNSMSSQFSYQSSNIGGVFGGRKPLISPPKFCNNSTPVFAPYIRYGPYYDITAAASPTPQGPVGHSPVMFTQHYFANPISRSSSQSSGFVSQQGGGPLSPSPPQSQTQTTAPGFCTGP